MTEQPLGNEKKSSELKLEAAVIGASIIVEGSIQGSEDLTIQGTVKGTIALKENTVTIGKNGRVEADIYARTIVVDGNVLGNLFGEEKVTVHRTGAIVGNIKCARVTLEDGARLKGSVDTETPAAEKPSAGQSAPDKSARPDKDTKDKLDKKSNGSLSVQQ